MRPPDTMLVACLQALSGLLASLLVGCAASDSRPVSQVPPPSPSSESATLAPISIPASVLYAPGPSTSTRSMLIDSSQSQEVRTSSAPDDTGKWTITVDQVKDAATTPRQRLIVSIDADGAVLLLELFNPERDSIATFTPPLRLLPANIQVASTASDTPSAFDEYRPMGDSKVRIIEGRGSKASTRTGTSRAFVQATLASASTDAQGPSVSVSTRLDIAVGPARIRRQSTYNLIPAHANLSGWTIQAESRDFSVRVGPITIERERSSLTGAIHNP